MTIRKRFTIPAVLALLVLGWAPASSAKTVITVGVYYFPPIAEVDRHQHATYLLGDLLHQIEATNPNIDFRIVYTSPKRRYLDFEAGLYDVIFFESADWGWRDRNVTISPPIMIDEELYVALKKPGRGQSFFDDIASHRVAALSGYHYRFSNFKIDTKQLEKEFNIEFSDSHSRNLQLIMADRPSVADIAATNRAYLRTYFSEHPQSRDLFLISEKPDYQLELRIIARKDGPVSANDLYNMLIPISEDGTYRSLAEKWGLEVPPGFPVKLPVSQESAP